jgi:hypothetical protein
MNIVILRVKIDITPFNYMTAYFSDVVLGTLIKSGRVKLMLWTKTPLLLVKHVVI